MRCIKLLIIPLLLISLSLSAQKRPMVSQEIIDYDYLSHKYEKLDENFKIHISSDDFEGLIRKYKYYPGKIKTCKDSLGVVLMGEFDNWDKARIAQQRIVFNYLRMSYYLWTSEEEVKKLCEKYDFKHTYHLYEFIRYDKELWDDSMRFFMKELRIKVQKATKNPDVMHMNSRDFLRQALINSPQRQKDYKLLQKNGKKGIRCGKANCCQDKKK